jgi:hypothetical protein
MTMTKNNNANNEDLGMKQIADLLAFFGLGYLLIIGISAQLIRMRK